MEYKILTHHDQNQLAREVEYWLDRGWKAQGGVAVAREHGHYIFAQALILEQA